MNPPRDAPLLQSCRLPERLQLLRRTVSGGKRGGCRSGNTDRTYLGECTQIQSCQGSSIQWRRYALQPAITTMAHPVKIFSTLFSGTIHGQVAL
ncbi:hypothetical protein AMECASPLE_009143 [Ameca splendens]|uniref:Uncharacterized protein n=1 Tax=Ameca splendens TaxID=208324 RepID=A0ABV0Y0E1_9TELE